MHPIEVEKAKKVDKDNDHHNQGRSNLVTIHPAMQDEKHHFAKQTHEKTCPYQKIEVSLPGSAFLTSRILSIHVGFHRTGSVSTISYRK
jgi:hypothetical protein